MNYLCAISICALVLATTPGYAGERGNMYWNDNFQQRGSHFGWKTIAVLPFSGPPHFRRPAGELFAVLLLKQNRYTIISPAIVEIELGKMGRALTSGITTVEDAREAAALLGADAVIMGSLMMDYRIKFFEGEVATRVTLIDATSGEEVARLSQSPLSLTPDQYEMMNRGVGKLAAQMLSVFQWLRGEIPEPEDETKHETKDKSLLLDEALGRQGK